MDFVVPNIRTDEQQRAAERISVLVHECGYKIIKVAQLEPAFQKIQGFLDVDYRQNRDHEIRKLPKFRAEITGNRSQMFVEDPFPQGLSIGTGRVIYLLDDNETVPENAKSSAKRGWNREGLASLYGQGLIQIVDNSEVEADVKKRHEEIMEAVRKDEPKMARIRKRLQERHDASSGRHTQKTEVILKHVKDELEAEGEHVVTPEPKHDTAIEELKAQNALLMKQIQEMQATNKPAQKKVKKRPARRSPKRVQTMPNVNTPISGGPTPEPIKQPETHEAFSA